jgi:arginine utilization protein RocB|tara:strand:+ start:37 stop:339 length:303 start_codon:yes stop_codon:yes gene_type:complete
MSNIEDAIQELVTEQVDSSIDDALANHYDFQDMMQRVDTLESESDSNAIDEEDILMRIAHLIVKDDRSNKTIVYKTHLDALNKEIEDLKKALADKEEVNG